MTDILQMLWTQSWQIAVLALMVAICARTIAKNRPHLAHAMWLLVLVKCVTPPMWGHSLGVFSQLQTLSVSDEQTDISTAEDVSTVAANLKFSPSDGEPTGSVSLIESELATLQGSQPIVRSNTANTASLITTPAPDVSVWKTAEPTRPSRDLWPGPLFFCLVIGAVATLSVMVVRCLSCLRSIYRHRTSEFEDLLNERLQMLSKKLRLHRVPRIIVSDVLFGPAVLGVLRHKIVLPRCLIRAESGKRKAGDCADDSTPLSAFSSPLSSLDPILAHELLHIRRGDLRTGLLQAIVQSLWWFHPAVWFCNRWLSREAERCCDEQVIAELGCSPAQYARSLLSVIESKHALQPIPVFPGMKPVEITSQRMERIMSLKTGLKKQTPLWCWLAVAAMAIVVLPGAIAEPQSEEKVVEAQPKEMGLPKETKVAVAPEVEVSTKTYIVGDLIERLAKEQNLSLDQARKSLLQIFESSVSPVHRHAQGVPAHPEILQQPLPPATTSPKVVSTARTVSSPSTAIVVLSSYAIDGDRIVVVQSAAGHATLQEYLGAVRQFGFTTFQVTARYIMGSPEEINSLMEALQLEKPFPKTAEAKAVPESSQSEKQSPQSAATFYVGTTGIVSMEEARKIEELARLKADCLSIQCPTVSAIDGQVATIQTGETKPFIVGFKENDEPMIRTVVEGLTLLVIPKVVDKGLFQLKSAACLEGTSGQRLIATTGRVTETPKMFTLPAITVKRLQTTVELQENQAFLQSGMITTEEGKSQAFLTVLEARLVAHEVAGKAVEKEGRAETLKASGGNPCRSAAELKSLIRLHEDFIVSPEVPLSGETVVAIVADEKILLADVALMRGLLQRLNRPPVVSPEMQQRVLRSFVERRLPKYLYDRIVLYEFESVVSKERKTEIRTSAETAFTELLQQLLIKEKAKDAEDLSRKLAVGGGGSVDSLREGFLRGATVDSYLQSLPAESPLRDRTAIESHCRQLMFEARLRQKISLSENGSSLASVLNDLDERYRVPISRNAIFQGDRKLTVTEQFVDQPLLEVIKKLVTPHGFQVVVGQEEILITSPASGESLSVSMPAEQFLVSSGRPIQESSNASTKTISSKVRATPETIEKSGTEPLVLLSYPVGELILPILSAKPDFAPLVELIKSTIEPDSWSEDAGQIVISHPGTLVIRQTPQVHDRIAKLLSQLLDDMDQVCVRFQLLKISSDIQLKGIQTRCSLHPIQDNKEWALLTKERSEEIVKFLTSEKAKVFTCPTITLFSGTTGQIRLGSSDGASNGLTILLGPRVIADIPVIRLRHSIDGSNDSEHDVVTRAMQDFPINAHESLIGSGQTLMLLVDANAESPGDQNEVSKPDPQSTKERFLVLLTVQRIEAQPVQ